MPTDLHAHGLSARARLVIALLATLGGCRDPEPKDEDTKPDDPRETGTPADTDTDTGEAPDEIPGSSEPWTREEETAPGSITFTEILYHSVTDPELEWIELHNPMTLDMDLSGWSLQGGVSYTFAEGTLLGAGEYLVVAADPSLLEVEALGPFEGSLSNGGERVELLSNGGRRMDTVAWGDDDPWPVAPDGSGVSLAKIRATDASDHAEHWTASAELGGSPGAENGLDPLTPAREEELIALDATWSYDDGGAYPDEDWADPDYDDADWATGEAIFYAGAPRPDELATVRLTADNYHALYLGEVDGAELRLVAEDYDGDWTTVESYEAWVTPRDHLYIAAWEATGDSYSPQMLIAEAELADRLIGTSAADFEWVLGPAGDNPGVSPPAPAPEEADLYDLIATASWEPPAVETGRSSDPWGWAVASSFDGGTQFIWADTFENDAITNSEDTYALFRSAEPLLGEAGTTELAAGTVTTTFRARFTLDADPATVELFASCVLDDGAVFYLNGVEVLRENVPAGAVDATTLASEPVEDPDTLDLELPTGPLARGENLLAVEVHQAERDDADLLFGCALSARISAASAEPTVRLSEVAAASASPFWVELVNASEADQALDGLVLASSGGEEHVLADGTLAPGALQTVEPFEVEPGEVLYLYSAGGAALLDAVRVGSRARGRDEQGEWRYPTEPSPGEENAVQTTDDVVINEIMYHRAPLSTEDGWAERDEEWIELYNRGEEAVDLGGWQLVDAVAYAFPEGTTLAPGGFLVVARDAAALAAAWPEAEIQGDWEGSLSNASDRVLLLDQRGNPADEVRYYDGGRWPAAADGGGSSLELMNAWADNGAAESWAASDERARTAWVSYEIEGTAEPSAVGPDGTWEELVLGLLDEGELLIDDLSVVQDPDTAPLEILQNGSFDDADHWRLLGNHRHSELVPDPDDPSNGVLRLVATGPTGHMHDHAETTLTRDISTKNYKISFRARWVWGSNQLHTRLYFNRLPTTTLLEQPALSGTPGQPSSRAVDNLGPSFSGAKQDVAVPEPGEAVEISVAVEDPDGVAAVSLWYAVDGGAWEQVEMSESAGRWSASLEGQEAGAIAQLYVEAEDGLGETATFPAAGADSRALVQWEDGEAATNGLHNLRLIMTEADHDWLLDDPNLMSNDLLGATVVYDESEVFWDVGVRAKGSERGRPETVRLGYAVRFDPEQLFRGSHGSALIDRSEGVSYGQREHLLNLVMMRAGIVSAEYNDLIHVITPRPEHTGGAELQLDRSTSLVLANQFERGEEGEVYDYELIYYPYTTEDGTAEGLKLPQPDSVVGTSITDLGDDEEAYRWNFTLQNNLGEDDYAPIMELCQTFSLRGSADFLESAAEVIDVDQWLRAFAVATLAGAVDQYGGDSSQHNARFYARPEDGKLLYFPHDLDFFGGSSMAVIGNTDLWYLLQDPVNERTYYQHLYDIVSRAYNVDYLQPWCERMGELLPDQDFEYNCAFIDERADWVLSGSSDAVAARFPSVDFAITTNGGEDLGTADGAIVLEGEGWIDVREIRLDGEAMETTWLDGQTWQLRVPLEVGANALVLEAYDLGGALVGSDAITVTRE